MAGTLASQRSHIRQHNHATKRHQSIGTKCNVAAKLGAPFVLGSTVGPLSAAGGPTRVLRVPEKPLVPKCLSAPPKSSRSAGSMAFAILRSQQSTRKEPAPRSQTPPHSSVDLRPNNWKIVGVVKVRGRQRAKTAPSISTCRARGRPPAGRAPGGAPAAAARAWPSRAACRAGCRGLCGPGC